MIRYTLPILPALAVAAGVLGADWLGRPRWRVASTLAVGVTVVLTGLYALAYMNVFRQPDSRVETSKWLVDNVPAGERILVEPSQKFRRWVRITPIRSSGTITCYGAPGTRVARPSVSARITTICSCSIRTAICTPIATMMPKSAAILHHVSRRWIGS